MRVYMRPIGSMGDNLIIYAMICAAAVVSTNAILNFLRERDKRNGQIVDPDQYKISKILKEILKGH